MTSIRSCVLLYVAFIAVSFSSTAAQPIESFPHGLAIEFGVGQNNLYWSGNGPEGPFGWVPMARTDFQLAPDVRITYQRALTEQFGLLPFLGYTEVGGINRIDRASHYTFRVLEAGITLLFKASDFSIGPGFKEKYNLTVVYDGDNGKIHEDQTPIFPSWSSSAGFRASYQVAPLTFSIEAWFGASNLLGPPGWSVHENHYRCFVGYTI